MSRRKEVAAYDAIEALMLDSGMSHNVKVLVDADGVKHTITRRSRRLIATIQSSDGKPRCLGNQLRYWKRIVVDGEEISVMGEDGGL